jgi:hypothetical protein
VRVEVLESRKRVRKVNKGACDESCTILHPRSLSARAFHSPKARTKTLRRTIKGTWMR